MREPSAVAVAEVYRLHREQICRAAGAGDEACRSGGLADSGAQRITLEEHCRRDGDPTVCAEVQAWPAALRLAYDHGATSWRRPTAGQGPARLAQRVEYDLNGIPTVALARGERLFVLMERSNPLLYQVSAGAVSEANVEQLPELQNLAALLGGNVAAVLAARGGEIQAQDIFARDVAALQQVADHLADAKCIADQATRYAFEAVAFVQAVEGGSSGQYRLTPRTCRNRALAVDRQAFDETWRRLLDDQAVVGRYCVEAPAALKALIDADPSKPDQVRQALTAYDVALQNPRCDLLEEHSGDGNSRDSQLREQYLDPIAQALADPAGLARQLARARQQLGVAVQTLQALLSRGGEALQQLIAGGATVRTALAGRELFRGRVLASLTALPAPCQAPEEVGAACAASRQIATFLVVRGGPVAATWDKVQTHPIKIALDSPFAGDVVAARPAPVDTSYRAVSTATSTFDLGVAVIETDLASPVFGVAKNAAGQTVIAITEEETRSGKLALMLDYMPLRQLLPDRPPALTALGLQLGAGTDGGNPAFFWGLSYGIGKYVRIGWGETSQRVKALRGQRTGEVVADKDALRTRQEFARERYLSLTVSLGSLSLFTAD